MNGIVVWWYSGMAMEKNTINQMQNFSRGVKSRFFESAIDFARLTERDLARSRCF